MITARLVGHSPPPPPLGHVRPVPFEHAQVIKVQYNNDNNKQSFVFYYCILHKQQQCDVALHKVATHCQSPKNVASSGQWQFVHQATGTPLAAFITVIHQSPGYQTKQHVLYEKVCQHVWVSVDMCKYDKLCCNYDHWL